MADERRRMDTLVLIEWLHTSNTVNRYPRLERAPNTMIMAATAFTFAAIFCQQTTMDSYRKQNEKKKTVTYE